MRAAHYAASDNMHAAQGALYEANAEVSKLEAEIRYVVESRNRVQAQIAALSAQGEQWREKAEQASEDLAQAEEELALSEGRTIEAQDTLAQRSDELPALEAQWREAQQLLNEQRAGIIQAEQALKLEAAQRAAPTRCCSSSSSAASACPAKKGLDRPDDVRLEELRADLAEQEAVLEEAQAALAEAEESLPRLDAERRAAQGVCRARPRPSPRWRRACRAAATAGERADRGQGAAVAGPPRAGRIAAAVEEDPYRARLGECTGVGAAREAGGARGFRPGRGQGLPVRRAARQAGLLCATRRGTAQGSNAGPAPADGPAADRRAGHPRGGAGLAR